MREWTSKEIALHLIICKLMYKNIYVLVNSKDTIENAAFGLRTTQKQNAKRVQSVNRRQNTLLKK